MAFLDGGGNLIEPPSNMRIHAMRRQIGIPRHKRLNNRPMLVLGFLALVFSGFHNLNLSGTISV